MAARENTRMTWTKLALRDGARLSIGHAMPFVVVHTASLAAFFVEFRWEYLVLSLALYYVGMFFVTAGYHRYFAHRTYRTSRAFQFVLAFMAMTAWQKGVLWWAAHHRHHHRVVDTDEDIHSPSLQGFWWAHIGWMLDDRVVETRMDLVPDLARYPELRWLNRYHLVPPFALAVTLFLLGGWGVLIWGFFIRTVLLWHGTFTVNSLAHIFGRRRYPTADTSKNSLVVTLITLGEGWHNHHHHFMAAARQGFFWWELDVTYYVLKILSWMGVVWALRQPPPEVLAARRSPS